MEILKGILTGLILSIPFGPVGIYCMELTITEGRWKGYITALGMVTIDVLYSMLALFFVKAMDDFIIKYKFPLQLFIGALLIYFSYKKLNSEIKIKDIKIKFESMFKNYFIGIGFALANISSIASITIIFSILKIYESNSSFLALKVGCGVFFGGSILWFITTAFIIYFKTLMRKEKLIKLVKLVNYFIFISGFTIIIYAIYDFTKFIK